MIPNLRLWLGCFILALPGPASGSDAALRESILGVLQPTYPEAAFLLTPNGRFACRLRSRVYRDPDRLGPDRGGLAVEYARQHSRWAGPGVLPSSETRDWRDFQEVFSRLPSGDGEGYLEVWIRTPSVNPPKEIVSTLVRLFQDHAAAWRPGPGAPSSVYPSLSLHSAWNYPGGDHVRSLVSIPDRKETHFTLDEILDSGQVLLNADQTRCILKWCSPDEGIGHMDVAVYRREAEGWRLEVVAPHLLLPEILQEGERLIVSASKGKALSLQWPRRAWREDGPLRDGIQRLLRAHDPEAFVRDSASGGVVGRLATRVYADPENEGPDDEPAEARVEPGPRGLVVTYRLVPENWAQATRLPLRRGSEHRGIGELHLTLPSGDGAGYLEATVSTPSLKPPAELREAVARLLEEFAAAWRPGLSDRRFGVPKDRWQHPAAVRTLAEVVDGARVFLDRGQRQCVLLFGHGGSRYDAVLYRKQGQRWRLRRVVRDASDVDLWKGDLRIKREEKVLHAVPWNR